MIAGILAALLVGLAVLVGLPALALGYAGALAAAAPEMECVARS